MYFPESFSCEDFFLKILNCGINPLEVEDITQVAGSTVSGSSFAQLSTCVDLSFRQFFINHSGTLKSQVLSLEHLQWCVCIETHVHTVMLWDFF